MTTSGERTKQNMRKVAYPKETKKLYKSLIKEPMSLSEINQIQHGSLMVDQLMKNGLIKRILVQQEENGPEYIYLEGVQANVTFKQGRRNFIRMK